MTTLVNRYTVVTGGQVPNRIAMGSDRRRGENRQMAQQAVRLARTLIPKMSGSAAKGLSPYWTESTFGIGWAHTYVWFQEAGIKPFTMSRLAGKTIPMWIDDPTGAEARKSPKAQQRTTVSGKHQILIFRKAALPGARKQVARRNARGGITGYRSVPRSYPGAPGRISHRFASGKIASTPTRATPHVGVRWRFPGLDGRGFLQHSVQTVAAEHQMAQTTLYATHEGRR